MRKAFTLIEVNLAILVMAGGILSIVGLYSLGFRENRQSAEDVAAAAYADAVISPLVMALSAPDVTWQQFNSIGNYPGDRGWAEYFNSDGIVDKDPEGKAQSVYARVKSAVGDSNGVLVWPSAAAGGLRAGLVVLHNRERDSGIVRIAFRATKIPGLLLSAPMYYAEVRFQGEMPQDGGQNK
jgi:type II secretory pathway pseudopilin PulG